MAVGYFALTSMVLLFIAHGSLSLRCYICDSRDNANCRDDYTKVAKEDCNTWCKAQGAFIKGNDSKPDVPCPTTFSSCRKIKQSTTAAGMNDGKTDERVFRTCGYLGSGNETEKPYIYRSSEAAKSEVYSCFTDDCNSAGSLQASVVVALATMLLGLLAL